ncbi:DUF1611 domain-containing protein [Pseudoalteromonas sp. T1lg23B]|uniref:DUF1611 domain-containing protein n=1 Tax=Pseudoalteromonas sp. T1lg23B TaxID=2077097 RepID=UPI000CF73A54|nr:DUF1611 domain-containing protein [Pseudoalteromonas sp. T1lg23B]
MFSGGFSDRKIVLLCEGNFGVIESKIASAFIRYNEEQCVAVINTEYAGQNVSDVLGWGHGIPIVATFAEAFKYEPDTLLIGVSVQGNSFPEAWRPFLVEAISNKLDIVAGLNFKLNDDAEFAALAQEHQVKLIDTKSVPQDIDLSRGRAENVDALIIHTVGTDCRVGKKTTALELTLEAKKRGIKANFGATGQTGIMISGTGICVDSVIVDFLGGATEKVVLDAAEGADWAVIEGQASIAHPAFAGGTMGMLYGAMPDALILCHHHNREKHYGYERPIPALQDLIEMYETVTKLSKPAKVVGVSLNTYPLSDEEAKVAIAELERELNLPVTDTVKFGAGKLVDALIDFEKNK